MDKLISGILTLAAVAIGGSVAIYVGYYLAALFFLWPRLLAKRVFLTNQINSRERYEKTKSALFGTQVVLMLLGVGLPGILSIEVVRRVLACAALLSTLFLSFQIMVYWLLPMVLGVTLIAYPPQALIRELSRAWEIGGKLLLGLIATIVLFLLVASNLIGVFFLLLGGVCAVLLRAHRAKDEIFKEKFDYFVKQLEKWPDGFCLAVIALRDIGTPQAIAVLNDHFRKRPEAFLRHEVGEAVLKEIGNEETVKILSEISKGMEGMSDTWLAHIQSLLRDIEERLQKSKHKA